MWTSEVSDIRTFSSWVTRAAISDSAANPTPADLEQQSDQSHQLTAAELRVKVLGPNAIFMMRYRECRAGQLDLHVGRQSPVPVQR